MRSISNLIDNLNKKAAQLCQQAAKQAEQRSKYIKAGVPAQYLPPSGAHARQQAERLTSVAQALQVLWRDAHHSTGALAVLAVTLDAIGCPQEAADARKEMFVPRQPAQRHPRPVAVHEEDAYAPDAAVTAPKLSDVCPIELPRPPKPVRPMFRANGRFTREPVSAADHKRLDAYERQLNAWASWA